MYPGSAKGLAEVFVKWTPAIISIASSPRAPAMLVEGPTAVEADVIDRHFRYLQDFVSRGVVLLAGRTTIVDESTFGIVIFRAASEAEATAVMSNDPAVREGVMRAALFPYRVALFSPIGWTDDAAGA